MSRNFSVARKKKIENGTVLHESLMKRFKITRPVIIRVSQCRTLSELQSNNWSSFYGANLPNQQIVHNRYCCEGIMLAKQGQEDRRCTFTVKMRRVRVTIVVVEKQYVLHTQSVCL
jgi:hypothetical protein